MGSTTEEAAKSETPTTDGIDVEKSPSSSPPPGELNTADDLMERGLKAYWDRNFTEATYCLRRALAIRVKHYGNFAPQCIHAYISYSLALLGNFPIPKGDDPMAFVPKGADYQHCFDKAGSTNAAKQDGNWILRDRDADGGVKWEAESLESAMNQLNMARAILKRQQRIAPQKQCILSALKEVAFQAGDLKSHLEVGTKNLSSTDPASAESTPQQSPHQCTLKTCFIKISKQYK